MPSFQDSVLIFLLALILFGPKKLPQLARQLGKLMAEFRRASNDFRMQMEEEIRIVEQEDQQKKLVAQSDPASETYPSEPVNTAESAHASKESVSATSDATENTTQPIAESGSITMRPPSTGYPEPAAPSTSPMASSNAGVVATPEAEHDASQTESEPGIVHG